MQSQSVVMMMVVAVVLAGRRMVAVVLIGSDVSYYQSYDSTVLYSILCLQLKLAAVERPNDLQTIRGRVKLSVSAHQS